MTGSGCSVFPVLEQFTLPPNTDLIGAGNPNDPRDKTKQHRGAAGEGRRGPAVAIETGPLLRAALARPGAGGDTWPRLSIGIDHAADVNASCL